MRAIFVLALCASASAAPCQFGDEVKCPDGNYNCAGNECCHDGSTCPSAANDFKSCPKAKSTDCTAGPGPKPGPPANLTCNAPKEAKENCGYKGVDESGCLAAGCCWQAKSGGSDEPWCFHAVEPVKPGANVTIRKVGYPVKLRNGRTTCGQRQIEKILFKIPLLKKNVYNPQYVSSILFHGFQDGTCTDLGFTRYEYAQDIEQKPSIHLPFFPRHNKSFKVDVFSRDPTLMDAVGCIDRECKTQVNSLLNDGYIHAGSQCMSRELGPCLPKAWDCLGDAQCRGALECLPEVMKTCGDGMWGMVTNQAERNKLECIYNCGKNPLCVWEKCGHPASDCLSGKDKTCHDLLHCVHNGLANCPKSATDCIFNNGTICNNNLHCWTDGAAACAGPTVNMLTDTHISSLMTCANQKCPAVKQAAPADMAVAVVSHADAEAESLCGRSKDCGSCNKNPILCHWCDKDQECHAKGSVFGCLEGSDCGKPAPAPTPPARDTCYDAKDCGSCYNHSKLCHWCSASQGCHEVGDVIHGCVIGVGCAAPKDIGDQLLCMGWQCGSKMLKLFNDQDVSTLTSCASDGLDGCHGAIWDCLGDATCQSQISCWSDNLKTVERDMWQMVTDSKERQFDEDLYSCVQSCAVHQCHVSSGSKVDCGFQGVGADECQSRGCCWDPAAKGSSEPWCFRPAKSNGVTTKLGEAMCLLRKCGPKALSCLRDGTCKKTMLDFPQLVRKCGLPSYKDEKFMNAARCLGRVADKCGKAGFDMIRNQRMIDLVNCNAQCARPTNSQEIVV